MSGRLPGGGGGGRRLCNRVPSNSPTPLPSTPATSPAPPRPPRRFCAREKGAPPRGDAARLLARFADVPKLLDMCAVFGAGGGALLSEILQAALSLLPRLATELAAAGAAVARNILQVADVCEGAGRAAAADAGMLQSLEGEGGEREPPLLERVKRSWASSDTGDPAPPQFFKLSDAAPTPAPLWRIQTACSTCGTAASR